MVVGDFRFRESGNPTIVKKSIKKNSSHPPQFSAKSVL